MGATVSPIISALRPLTDPTTASGRTLQLTAAHHRSNDNTAHCRSLPRTLPRKILSLAELKIEKKYNNKHVHTQFAERLGARVVKLINVSLYTTLSNTNHNIVNR